VLSAAVLLGVTLAAGGHLLGHLDDRLIGHALGEAHGHAWLHWLFARKLQLGLGDPFLHQGVFLSGDLWLWPLDPVNQLLAQPLHWLLGEPAATNLLALGQLLLAAAAAWWLARCAGARAAAAAVAAALLALHPATLGYLADGRIDSLAIGPALLVVAAWLALLRRPSRRAAVALGAAVGLLGAWNANWLYLCALVLAPLSLLALALAPRRRGPSMLLAALLAALLATPSMAAVMAGERHPQGRQTAEPLPQTGGLVQTIQPGDVCSVCTMERFAGWLDRGPASHDLLAWPAGAAQLDPVLREATFLPSIAPGTRRFVGFTQLLLGLGALLLAPRRSAAWLAATLALLWLSTGPGLPLGPPGGADRWLLRSAPLVTRLPFGAGFSNYGLFGMAGQACWATGVALGLSALAQRWQRLPLVPVAIACLAAWTLEVQLRSPVPLPLRTTSLQYPALLTEISRRPGGGAVLLANRRAELDRLLQTVHERPILTRWGVDGWTTGVPEADAFLATIGTGTPGCLARAAGSWRGELSAAGIGWVLDLPGFTAAAQPARDRCLDHMLGPTHHDDQQLRAWQLEEHE